METRGLGGPARVLILVDQPLIAEVIELTLNHGVYATRQAKNLPRRRLALDEWRPHLAVVDMDIGGDRLVQRLDAPDEHGGTRIPTLGPDASRRPPDQAGRLRAGRRRHHDDPVLARGAARPRAGDHPSRATASRSPSTRS